MTKHITVEYDWSSLQGHLVVLHGYDRDEELRAGTPTRTFSIPFEEVEGVVDGMTQVIESVRSDGLGS